LENKYEILFIIKSGTTEVAREKAIKKYEDIITKSGGTISLVDRWGNRRFCYPIDFKNEGFYVLIYFSAKPSVPAELERVMRISDDIVRFMVLNRNGMGEPIPRKKKEHSNEQGQSTDASAPNAEPAQSTVQEQVVEQALDIQQQVDTANKQVDANQ